MAICPACTHTQEHHWDSSGVKMDDKRRVPFTPSKLMVWNSSLSWRLSWADSGPGFPLLPVGIPWSLSPAGTAVGIYSGEHTGQLLTFPYSINPDNCCRSKRLPLRSAAQKRMEEYPTSPRCWSPTPVKDKRGAVSPGHCPGHLSSTYLGTFKVYPYHYSSTQSLLF